jgi:PEP-CTERM motif
LFGVASGIAIHRLCRRARQPPGKTQANRRLHPRGTAVEPEEVIIMLIRARSWLVTSALAFSALLPAPAFAAVFSDAGATAADIQVTVDAFRTALGTLNPNTPGSFGSGRREINWDGVPDAFSSPNAFPGNFFNANAPGRARGAEFTTPGTSLEVSAGAGNPTATPTQFGNLHAGFPTIFEPFSQQKLFTAIGSNIVDVHFFIPGTSSPALTNGFGAVFADVDLDDVSSLSFYDAADNLLATRFVPALLGDQTLSFLGETFTDAIVSRVRIVSGNTTVSPNVTLDTNGDYVVMDDFIYGEPVPEPATWLLLAAGFGAIAWLRGKRSL